MGLVSGGFDDFPFLVSPLLGASVHLKPLDGPGCSHVANTLKSGRAGVEEHDERYSRKVSNNSYIKFTLRLFNGYMYL